MWSFGRKIAAGFGLAAALVVAVGIISYRSVTGLTDISYTVTHTHVVLEHLASVLSYCKDAETGQRGYIITGYDDYLEPYQTALTRLPETLKELRALTTGDATQQARLDQVDTLVASKFAELKHTIDMRRTQGADFTIKYIQQGEGKKVMDDLRHVLDQMEQEEREALHQRGEEVESTASRTRATINIGTFLCLLLTTAAGVWISRSLTNQIGTAVHHVRSSSAQLQSSATQQLTGAKESATAMSEITTTISELLATSKQIAESARRVANIAGETSSAARTGDQTAQKAHDSVGGIKRQVDLIVNHMLDLGKRSQHIGGILEIINELAEQTNILAINASIEAAGAGESGKRFAVVADEIRKLADRVGASTKEIRVLIEEIRAAVNTTVMATEGGSKAVDVGTRQFFEVTDALKNIAHLVTTTTEAAREIELSTKQQSTAVEQVNVAISNVALATKESESNSNQTLQTATELTGLSLELTRLIQANAGA